MNNQIYSSKFKSVAFAMMTPLLSAAVLISAQPAQAQSFIFASNNNGLNAAQATSINNLNTTRAQANASISTAVANGTLSVDQASLYQNQLNANANEQNNYVNSGNFNFAQMQSVLTNLQNTHTSITSSISAGATNNFNTNNSNNYDWNNGRRNRGNGRWNNGYNQVNTSYWTGIDGQLSVALTRIQDGLNNRSLSQFEYNDLKRQYDLIVSREAQYKASGGRFSNSERTALERQIDALNSSIAREVTDRERANNNTDWNNGRRNRGNGRWNNGYNQVNTSYWSGIDSQLSAALTRIQDGLNNRSLSQFEYNDLKRQYDLIVSREAQYKTSGGRFSNSERTALERQIDALNSSITREVTDRERANNRQGRWR